jgi:hypothetical protein
LMASDEQAATASAESRAAGRSRAEKEVGRILGWLALCCRSIELGSL